MEYKIRWFFVSFDILSNSHFVHVHAKVTYCGKFEDRIIFRLNYSNTETIPICKRECFTASLATNTPEINDEVYEKTNGSDDCQMKLIQSTYGINCMGWQKKEEENTTTGDEA